VKGFVRAAGERLGGINVLVNNARVLLDGLLVKEEGGWVKRLPAAQWRRVLEVNLTGCSWWRARWRPRCWSGTRASARRG